MSLLIKPYSQVSCAAGALEQGVYAGDMGWGC